MPRARGTAKVRLVLSVTPEIRSLLEEMAAERRRSISVVVEDLVREADCGLEDYYRKQAAFHGFMAAAVSAALASRVLGVEATRGLQDQAAATARRLYGRSPIRNFDIEQGLATEEDDPRVRALFVAYGAR